MKEIFFKQGEQARKYDIQILILFGNILRSSEDGTSVNNFFSGLVLVFLEVLLEHTSELLEFLIISSLVGPGILGGKNVGINSWASNGNLEVEDREGSVFDFVEFTTVDSVDDLSSDLETHSLADTVFTT